MKRIWQLRAIPGALVILTHLVFFAVLIRHTDTRSIGPEAGPANYIGLALIQAKAKPKPVEAAAPPPVARTRKAVAQQDHAVPLAPVIVPAMPDSQESAPGQAAPQGKRLDMEALRTAARGVEQERVPTALERLRESEQMRSEDDGALARGIKRARRPDCRTAYAPAEKVNLILLIPLALDTIRDKGCKW